MADEIKIEKSQIISGSRISHSRISNVASGDTAPMTPEMWNTLFRLVDAHGQARESESARELKALLDRGHHREAKAIWQHLRSLLGDLAHVSKIAEVMRTLLP